MDGQPKTKDDKTIPPVLTYHPALNKADEILKDNSKLFLVDDEHKEVFQNKMFLSFQKAKSLKDELVRAKLPGVGEPPLAKGTYRCNGRKSCQICNVITEEDSLENSDENRSFKNFSGRYNCNSENVVYLLQCEICSKKYVGSTKTKFRQRFNVYKSYFRSYARKHSEGSLGRGKLIPQANFLVISLRGITMGNLRLGLK